MELAFLNRLLVFTCFLFSSSPLFSQTAKKDPASQLWGYVENENWEIEPTFTKAWPFQEKVAKVQIGKHYYLINQKGKFLSEAYDYIGWADDKGSDFQSVFWEDVIGFKKGRLWGLINRKGKVMLNARYAAIFSAQNGLMEIATYDTDRERLLYGVINPKGEEVVLPRFEELEILEQTQTIKIGEKHGLELWQWGLLSFKGQSVLPMSFKEITEAGSALFKVTDSLSMVGLYKVEGEEKRAALPLSAHQYQLITDFSNGNAAAVKRGKWGIIDSEGREKLPFQHRFIQLSDSGWVVQSYPEYQLTDLEGKALSTYYYDRLENIGPQRWRFWLNGASGLMDTGENVFAYGQFDQMEFVEPKFYLASLGDQLGVFDENGKPIVPMRKQKLVFEKSGLWRSQQAGQADQFFNADGKQLRTSEYEEISSFRSGKYKAKKQGKYGFLNANLQEEIPFQFEKAEDFTGNQAVIQLNGSFGAIDTTGKFIIRPRVDSLATFSKGKFFFKDNGFLGTLDHQGIEWTKGYISGYQIDKAGFIFLSDSGKMGLISSEGKLLLPVVYDSLRQLEEGTFLVWQNGQRMFMPTDSREIPTDTLFAAYNQVMLPTEGLAAASQEGRWGFIDHMGRMVITCQYDSVRPLSNGMAAVLIEGGWGYLNAAGKLTVQPRYQNPAPFTQNGVIQEKKGKKGVIGFKSEWILPPEYDRIEVSAYGNWLVRQGEKWGIYSPEGLQGIYPKYEFLADMGNGYVITRKNGKYGFDRLNGFSVVFPTKDMVNFNPYQNNFLLITEPRQFIWNP